MSITTDNLVFYKSERMTDNSDGGGRMTATQIVPNVENQIFDDISDVDRASGDVSIRKIYASVTSADTSKYLDAGVVVFKPPTDTAATVMAFSSGDFYDQHSDLQTLIEQTITRGSRWNGYLWGDHSIGQRAVVLWQLPDAALPSIGGRLNLASSTANEFIWITGVAQATRTLSDDKGTYPINEITLEIAESLVNNYTGTEPTRYTPTSIPATQVYDTRYNADAVPLHGIMPLNAAANVGDYAVTVDSLYTPIIPTAFTETALADTTPGSGLRVLVKGNTNSISFATFTQCVKPSASLYLNSPCYPGSLSITGGGSTLTDKGGNVLLGTTVVGTVDYVNGVATFNDSCPNLGGASKTISFIPAAAPTRVANTFSTAVTISNQGFVWTTTLTPIPCPGSLSISYLANAKWYTLTDDGSGNLSGADSSYGSGKINFTSGTVTLTTGVKPDVGSEIIFSWGIPINSTAQGGNAVAAPSVQGQTANKGIVTGTISVSWGTYTLTDTATPGILAGTGGTGTIDYPTGIWKITPTLLPAPGVVFTITYSYGESNHETFTANGLSAQTIALSKQNVIPRSVTMEWVNNTTHFIQVSNFSMSVSDDGDGNFVDNNSSTINYTNGAIAFQGALAVVYQEPIYGMVPYFNGFTREVIGYNPVTQQSGVATGPINIYYSTSTSGATAATETVTLSSLVLNLTPNFAETIVPGSTRLLIGSDLFCDFSGKIYRNPTPNSGVGTLCGTLDPSSGTVLISNWTSGITNAVTLQSLTTDLSTQPIGNVTFRTPLIPIKPGTLQLRATTTDGVTLSKTVDTTGSLIDTDCTITVNYQTGVVLARFGEYLTDAQCTTDDKQSNWYGSQYFVTIGGVQKIWKPTLVLASSLIYNAVAETFLPPNSALLGINAARLPPDGKALAFNIGRLALVHNTQTITETTLTQGQAIDCGRTRLYRAVIADSAGNLLPSTQYTLNRETGIITLATPLVQTGFTAPWVVSHTVADLVRIADMDISGKLTTNKAISHSFPATTSHISSVLYFGTLQAGVANVFSQSTWTGVWQSTVIDTAPLAQYNNALYPIAVTNAGAYPDKYLILFTSPTEFNIIGKNLGFIGIGNINQNCTPINSLTGIAYLTIDYRGWGSNWSAGYCLRFDVTGACYPVDLLRAIQPSDPTTSVDSVELLLIGNIDA